MPDFPPYSVAIATRNRASALQLSLPRILAQTIAPAQIVIVDSSDDALEVPDITHSAARLFQGDLQIFRGEKGLTRQRNAALARVDAPITFFPDDDSIWFPDTAERILEAYRADSGLNIAAVCAKESKIPPPDFDGSCSGGYESTIAQKLRRTVAIERRMLEKFLAPNPLDILGKRFISECHPVKNEEDTTPVAYMTGFRMSFRTEVIRQFGFDETLTNYSLNEDIDASFHAWRFGRVVAAQKALVFHHRAPGARDNGFTLGVTGMLNVAYVISKHAPPGDASRAAFERYFWYRMSLYTLGITTRFGRDRFLGARTALPLARKLAKTPPSEARDSYISAIASLSSSTTRQ